MHKLFGTLFILTGIFAIAGGLYTWGEGSIFDQNELEKVWVPWADIVLTGPISILAGIGVLKKASWGRVFGLVTSGIYIFGSLLVFIHMIWNSDYSIFWIVPAVSGVLIGAGFVATQLHNNRNT